MNEHTYISIVILNSTHNTFVINKFVIYKLLLGLKICIINLEYKLSNEINGIDKIMGFKHTTVENRFSMTAGIGFSIHVRIKHFNFVTNYC